MWLDSAVPTNVGIAVDRVVGETVVCKDRELIRPDDARLRKLQRQLKIVCFHASLSIADAILPSRAGGRTGLRTVREPA